MQMCKASDKLIKKGFDIGSECYIFYNGKIVKSKIIKGDYIFADDFIYTSDYISTYVTVEVDKNENINGWHNETLVKINKLYKTYGDADKNRKKIISVKDFIDGDENVHKNNILAKIKVKTDKEYSKLKKYIEETYIINDNENHIFDDIYIFPCVIIVIENNNSDILTIKQSTYA